MGNTSSNEDRADQAAFTSDDNGDGDDDASGEFEPILDLSALFSIDTLSELNAKAHDEPEKNVIQQNRKKLLQWLENRCEGNIDLVSQGLFCEFLSSNSVKYEDAVEAFRQLDVGCDGEVNRKDLLATLRSYPVDVTHDDISRMVKALKDCTLSPGFVDVYNDVTPNAGQHGMRILDFLLRNRAPTHALPRTNLLNNLNEIAAMRLSVLKLNFTKLLETVSDEGGVVQTTVCDTKKSVTLLEVSSNVDGASRLLDESNTTPWVSSGRPQSHWIRLKMAKDIVIRKLFVKTDPSDSSYVPEKISVMVGSRPGKLHSIKDVTIPLSSTGYFLILNDAKVHYPYVELRITKCHSDGCDTKVHGIKVVGVRRSDPQQQTVEVPSIESVLVSWYLQILAATATSCLPVVPHLKDTILQHTRSALEHLPPLCLSPDSTLKPANISRQSLDEIEAFLHNVSLQDTTAGQLSEWLVTILGFSLARGHVANIVTALMQIDKADMELNIGKLLRKMENVLETLRKKYARPLKVSLVGCDADANDSENPAENVLSTSQGGPGFMSIGGCKKANMLFKCSSEKTQLTRLIIEVQQIPASAKRGLVFIFSHPAGTFDFATELEKFAVFDSWQESDYSAYQQRGLGDLAAPCGPVAHFEFSEAELELTVELPPNSVGQFVLVKFLEPRQSTADKLQVTRVKFFGVQQKSIGPVCVIPGDCDMVHSRVVVRHTLSFILSILSDQPELDKLRDCQPMHLDVKNLSANMIWNVYQQLNDRQIRIILLHILHASLPFLRRQPTDKMNEEIQDLFRHLCKLVDDGPAGDQLVDAASVVILDGAALFFPDEDTRHARLMELLQNSSASNRIVSSQLTLQSLCQLFSSLDVTSLFKLPTAVTKEFDASHVLNVMEMLLNIASDELQKQLVSRLARSSSSPLEHLLCSLQTRLLSWCHRQLVATQSATDNVNVVVQCLIDKYVKLVSSFISGILKSLPGLAAASLDELISLLDGSFVSTLFPQMILTLNQLCDLISSRTRDLLVTHLKSTIRDLYTLYRQDEKQNPAVDETPQDDGMKKTWIEESPHPYQNDQDFTKSFACIGATEFAIELDERCQTERRYDYIEFSDEHGAKQKFDGKFTTTGPHIVVFRNCSRITFRFHSDSSGVDWGYKFKVTAKTAVKLALSWVQDTCLSLSMLLGRLCAATLDDKLPAKDTDKDLLTSELWTTLFRGGYLIKGLMRTFSGRYEAESETLSCGFLLSLTDKDNIHTQLFLSKCREAHHTQHFVGGSEVDETITSVFAALLWHTQPLREEIEKYVKNNYSGRIMPGIHQAYSAAESLRIELAGKLQNLKAAAEQAESTESKPKDAPDSESAESKPAVESDSQATTESVESKTTDVASKSEPVVAMESETDSAVPVDISFLTQIKSKAQLLMRFAGCLNVQSKTEAKIKLSRVSSLVGRQASLSDDSAVLMDVILDKYPSFSLVLEFLKDPSWSEERVEEVIKFRQEHGEAVAKVYMFISEFLQISFQDDVFQAPNVLFLQELLRRQDKFHRHYTSSVDGCGLKMEADVRKNYYALLRRLVDGLRNKPKSSLAPTAVQYYDYIAACVLHFLDIAWQLYDLPLLHELRLPDLLISLIIDFQPSPDEKPPVRASEDFTAEEYTKQQEWVAEFKTHGTPSATSVEEGKAIKQCKARYSKFLNAGYRCDGCGASTPGVRYRCLVCSDVDICVKCFENQVIPASDGHSGDHDVVHFNYHCDACHGFIVGTRVHCLVCDDFDLCLGCFNAGAVADSHEASHATEKFPTPLVKQVEADHTLPSITAYNHLHSALLFSTLALSTSVVVFDRRPINVDLDYVKTAGQLFIRCVELCIEKLTESTLTAKPNEGTAEKLVGLLAAVLPPANKALQPEINDVLTSREFITKLFSVLRLKSELDKKSQLLVLGLIGKLLQRANSTTMIQSISLTDSSITDDTAVVTQTESPCTIAQFLFNFGASCFERDGLEWLKSVISMIHGLLPFWNETLVQQFNLCIQQLKNSKMSSIFALFVASGFPKMLLMGTRVTYRWGPNREQRDGVIVKHSAGQGKTELVDLRSRRRETVKVGEIEEVCSEFDLLKDEHVSVFSEYLQNAVKSLETAGASHTSVESLWSLALVTKCLLRVFTRSRNVGEMYRQPFVDAVVYLAQLGTRLNKNWRLHDLEVLSLLLYMMQSAGLSDPTACVSSVVYVGGGGGAGDDAVDSETAAEADLVELLDDIDNEDVRAAFTILHESEGFSPAILRAVYELRGRGNVLDNLDIEDLLTPNAEIQERARQLKVKKQTPVVADDETDVDTGLVFPSRTFAANMNGSVPDEPVVEMKDDNKAEKRKLLGLASDKTDDQTSRKQSEKLLEKALEQQRESKDSAKLNLGKYNRAIAILFARRLLVELLAQWPVTDHPLSADVLGCSDDRNLPFVLNLIYCPELKDKLSQIVEKLINHTKPEGLAAMALTSCDFIDDFSLVRIVKETPKNHNGTLEDVVGIPGVTSLKVHFDDQSCTDKEDSDGACKLTIASSPDYESQCHTFSGPHENWKSIKITGDCLYYKFTGNMTAATSWGYKFTVTGTTPGSFDVGHSVLNVVFNISSVFPLLPVDVIWQRLVSVACRQKCQQRLQAIQLLLKLLSACCQMKKDEPPEGRKPPIALGLLKPIWHFYHRLSAKRPTSDSGMVSPLVQALAELFVLAETAAQEWNVVQEYLEIVDKEIGNEPKPDASDSITDLVKADDEQEGNIEASSDSDDEDDDDDDDDDS